MAPRLCTERLAGINWVADAGAAEIARQSFIEPRYTPLAVWAVKPLPFATKVNPSPRDAHALGCADSSEVKQHRVTGYAHFHDARPSQRWANGHPASVENTPAPKVANVETAGRQRLDRHSSGAGVKCHNAAPKIEKTRSPFIAPASLGVTHCPICPKCPNCPICPKRPSGGPVPLGQRQGVSHRTATAACALASDRPSLLPSLQLPGDR
jgi:hypothetical protein